MNKTDIEKKNIEHKILWLQKPQIMKRQKEFIQKIMNEHFKKMFKMKFWLKLINFVTLIRIFKNHLDVC